jgi:nucleoside-diphosphate-sugar epimerase
MRVLITGNMGYIGPCVVRRLRQAIPGIHLTGFDAGYFAHTLLNPRGLADETPDLQIFGDTRDLPAGLLEGVDAVVHLAAVSNDPMGKEFEEATFDVNYRASVALAAAARKAGARAFVFASSCSVYGFAEDGERTELSELNPLTAYARSKHQAEQELAALADSVFRVTCLRFATACGISPRLRLDLVLNDFVATALRTGEIRVLSDGSPWRPLINVADMARAIEWSIQRPAAAGGEFLAVNAGSNQWNYQVKDLAEAVAAALPGTSVSINKDAQPDRRSYRVSFNRFAQLAPSYQPVETLQTTIAALIDGLEQAGVRSPEFQPSRLVRLKTLIDLKSSRRLDAGLRWSSVPESIAATA